jgi:GTP-binding protein
MAARFIISAAKPEQFPPEDQTSLRQAEVAFLGRSNVGKSSLINALAGAGLLAYTSSRPGCTQSVNFFQLDDGYRFVDLPGYGFAKVPKQITREWKELIESYLLGRGSLRLAILVLDARRGWMEKDLELRQWLETHGRPYLVVATKVDKLKTHKERHESQKNLRAGFADNQSFQANGTGEILECSATTGRGVREIWQAISKIKTRQ